MLFFSECPSLTTPAAAAGSLSTTDRYEGITVTLTCNSGYTLVGDSSSTCNSGSWSTTLGTCEQGKVEDDQNSLKIIGMLVINNLCRRYILKTAERFLAFDLWSELRTILKPNVRNQRQLHKITIHPLWNLPLIFQKE